jgi:voltage-gated potassium channel
MPGLNNQNNFIYLTIAMISVLLGASLTQSLPADSSRHLINLLIILMSLIAVKSLNLGVKWPRTGWVITGGIVISVLLHRLFGWKETDYVQLLLMLALFLGITIRASRQVLLEGSIDANKIIGSVALYILLGLIWTVLYLLTIEFDPLSFNGITERSWAQNFSQVAYFSFVTLTTLGYGDISPATRFAEFLVYFEAIFGVFYIAIFVAGLIGVAQAKAANRRE